MTLKPYPQINPSMTLSLGGYTCLRPSDWRKFLRGVARTHYPWYAFTQRLSRRHTIRGEANDCILTALEGYLFNAFGLVVPRETLFPVFNRQGKGLLPENMMAAITAVVEPLGFEIDRVLAPDPILRQGLKLPDRVVDLSHASYFHGRSGISMINIRNGYNHAFYWDCMDQARFTHPDFRLAVLLRTTSKLETPTRSCTGCLLDLSALAYELAASGPQGSLLRSEAESLRRCAQKPNATYIELNQSIETILALATSGSCRDLEILVAAASLSKRVIETLPNV